MKNGDIVKLRGQYWTVVDLSAPTSRSGTVTVISDCTGEKKTLRVREYGPSGTIYSRKQKWGKEP